MCIAASAYVLHLRAQVDYCVPTEGNFTVTARLGGRHVRGSPSSHTVFRDVAALAGREMEARLADSVGGLRRGLAQVISLPHLPLSYIPSLATCQLLYVS